MALLSITVAFNASSANFCGSISCFFFTITLDSGLLICVQPETHLVVLRQLGLDWHLQTTPRQAVVSKYALSSQDLPISH